MYGLSVYITPQDVIDKLSDEDKKRFNQCVFTDVTRGRDGTITIDCIVFNDPDPYVTETHRQKYFSDNPLDIDAFSLETNKTLKDIRSGKGLSKI